MAARLSNFNKLRSMQSAQRQESVRADSSLLSGLTPTQIALLFPDYFKRGTPDVGGFYAAISKASAEKQALWQGSVESRLSQQGGMLSRMRQEYGEGGAGKISNPVKAQEIYNYLRSKGVDHVHAVGMLNNMEHESKLDSGAYNPNDVNGPSGGLFQHHSKFSEGSGGRFNDMVRIVGPDWKTNWKKQIDFALQEDDTKRYLSTNFESASAASVGFTQMFERPRDPNAGIERLSTVKSFDRLTPTDTATADAAGKGTTPQQAGQGGTPEQREAGGSTGQQDQKKTYKVVDGYVLPTEGSLYDPRNASQCATLSKAFNPNIGRSSGWTIVDGDIKAGQVVATKQYNNPGADKTGAGYHTGVALTAPNEKGDFLLLEQYNGSGGAKTKWVNKDSYPIPGGGTTSFGLISSGGKVHDEVSQEALAYGERLGGPNKESVGTNAGTPGQGGESAPGVEGEVSTGGPEGDQQSASLMQPMSMMQNLMGMAGGLMGGTASPLGLITSAMGFIMPLIGSIGGERLTGEGMGDIGPTKMPGITIGAKPHRKTNPVNAPADPKDDYMRRVAIEREAKKLGIDPHHLSTAMLYESIGSLNPNRMGVVDKRSGARAAVAKGAQNRFMGLIQFGAAEQNRYGVKPNMSFSDQMSAVGRYLEDKGLKRWMEKNPNATEQEKRIALYSTINAGGPDKKHWHKTDKRYGGSSTTIIQKTEHMFKDWGGRAEKIMAAKPTGDTQFADARPASTTGTVGPGPSTPTAGPTAPTQVAAQPKEEKGIFQRAKEFTDITAGKSIAQPTTAPSGSPATPASRPTGTTPTYVAPGTPSVSTSISSIAAPATAISSQARNPQGIYSSFKRSDIEHQFGYGKKNLAPVPMTNPTAVTPVTGTQMRAPGPGPDTTTMQMNQTTALTSVLAASQSQRQAPQTNQSDSSILNHDHSMKMIQNSIDTPSMGRAMGRIEGRESDTRQIGNNRDYGNSFA